VDPHHVPARIVHRLLDRHGDLAGLALTYAHATIAIPHHRKRRKTELPSAFDDLRHTVDADELFLEVIAITF
jgi:hypothetical protein